ncbi:uncharacterized protein TNCV_302831 [Trichonephila clavipes]|nr:uncharacterized protein TNCV_302831 [Trichonephila clavipes]
MSTWSLGHGSKLQGPSPIAIGQLFSARTKTTSRAMVNLVVRASDSRTEDLGSMPPNTLQVHTEYVLVKSVGPKVLWAESRVQRTGEYFTPLQLHAEIVEVVIGRCRHLSFLRGISPS